eukprot:scaffold16142_cov68-Phaeocystis_antarctica.AAC.3
MGTQVAPPPCKLLMRAETGGAGRPRCDTPWSAYLNFSFAAPPYGPVPIRHMALHCALHSASDLA